MKTIPYAKFSTEMVEPTLRQDMWIETAKKFKEVVPIRKNELAFNGSVEVWDVDGVFFGSVGYDPVIMEHRKSVHNRSGEHDFICLVTYRQGGAKVIHDGMPGENQLHDVNMFDYRFDRRSVNPKNSRKDAIIIPYKAIGFESGQHAALTTFSHTNSTGYVLSKFISMIREKIPTATLEEGQKMSAMLTGALRNVITEGRSSSAKQQATFCRRAVMQRFVIENIHDLSLNVETLCRKFEVSRATVFRDFEPGGLQNFMMLHRLDRALNDIASGPVIRGRIALISNQWGFSSPAHFSRAFRERFGFSPSEAAGIGREVGKISIPDTGLERDWTPVNVKTGSSGRIVMN